MLKILKIQFLAAFTLALAGCTGPIAHLDVTLPSARERTHFTAHVDGMARQAGLRALPDHPVQGLPQLTDRQYNTTARALSEFSVQWYDNKNEVDVWFPDDGLLDTMAAEIRKYAHATYGEESVSTYRQIPILHGVKQAWDQ